VLELCTLISADLNSYRPRADVISPGPIAGPSSFGSEVTPSEEPRFPKSLYLIQPLFSGYELNPVGTNAQASVAIPEGLDLDSWIVSPPLETVSHNVDDKEDGSKKKARGKKMKGKDVGSSITSKKKKGNESHERIMLIPIDSEETPEERIQREKVRTVFFVVLI